ncbi:MAG: hypothetical protein WBO04_12170 [Steroidobacteraceae bacterium]
MSTASIAETEFFTAQNCEYSTLDRATANRFVSDYLASQGVTGPEDDRYAEVVKTACDKAHDHVLDGGER